ncbi:MAG: molybdenum cofactor biosynthesis protein MoaE [Candidatus Dormibacteraceae bacterium]
MLSPLGEGRGEGNFIQAPLQNRVKCLAASAELDSTSLRLSRYEFRNRLSPHSGFPLFTGMQINLTISDAPIDEAALLAQRSMSSGMGAAVYFLGVVRSEEQGEPIVALEYESFQRMAEHQFRLLFSEMENRWSIESVRLVHRLGVVKVNEPSLWVEVIAPHRGEAFAACQWLIDEMKRVVPIWKRGVGRDG